MKIIVIDDSDIAREITSRVLRDAGMDVETLPSALGAAAAIFQHKPDLVLLDIDMPALNGETAAGILKRQAPLRAVRVVLFSGKEPAALEEAVRRCGADGYVRKTNDFDALVAEVRAAAALPVAAV